MKKLLIIAVAMIFMSLGVTSANAMQIKLAPGALGTGDGVTGIFSQLELYIQTTSTITPTGPTTGTFTDVGDLNVTNLLPPPVIDNEGLPAYSWSLYGGWSDLAGSYTVGTNPAGHTSHSYVYTSGTMKMYASSGAPFNYNSSASGSDDDTGFTGPAADEVAALTLINGTGDLDVVTGQGDVNLVWQFTSMKPGFWQDAAGNSLDTSIPLVLAIADANTDDVIISGNHIYSTHNGSVDIAIPEPASMMLLGSGLLGLAGAGLKKKRS